MKHYKLTYLIFLLAIGFLNTSCEDDDPISAGNSDPLNKKVVNIEGTITPNQTIIGEGNILGFQVSIPNSFSTKVTITTRIEMDNGRTNIGTAVIEAGATTGTGTIAVPADDDVITGDTIGGVANAAKLFLIAILLEDLEPNTTYTISSNTADLGIYSDTLPAGSGLNVLLDWENSDTINMNLYMGTNTNPFIEFSESSTRFESDLWENAGRADGEYFVLIGINGPSPTEDVDYELLFTLPDGSLEVLTGTVPAGIDTGFVYFVARFEKSTDAVTGEVSYINIGPF